MKLHSNRGTLRSGLALSKARGAIILVHGRGSSPDDIMGLSEAIPSEGLAFMAPAATTGTWYPQRFLAPVEQNEPWLSSALQVIDELVAEAKAAGLAYEQIALIGFSQGACLSLESATRSPHRYGFVAGLSGALIGPSGTARPKVDLQRLPVLLGCAELDGHIPLELVEESATILSSFGADVTKQIYRGSAHTVFPDEIKWLDQQVAKLVTVK